MLIDASLYQTIYNHLRTGKCEQNRKKSPQGAYILPGEVGNKK